MRMCHASTKSLIANLNITDNEPSLLPGKECKPGAASNIPNFTYFTVS